MNGDIPADYDPRFMRLAAYLAAKAPPGKLPGRQHVEPSEIIDLLPNLRLIEVVPQPGGPPRYRIRLAGTEVVEIFGVDGTGRFVDEVLQTDRAATIIRAYEEMLRTKRPQCLRGRLSAASRRHVSYQRVAFPLATNGVDVDMLLFMIVRVAE